MIIFLYCIVFIIINYKKKLCFNIAHACGVIDSTRYTNSLEAFQNSYSHGFRYIEIDLLVLEGKHIIGGHDIDHLKFITNISTHNKLNINYIKNTKLLSKYHIIYDDMIFILLNKYKDVYIFTDKITDYILLKKYGKLVDRIYVEVFDYIHYAAAKKEGFSNVMLNIRYEYELRKLLHNNNTISAITIGPSVFYNYKNLLQKLFNKNIKIFAFLIHNSTDIKSSYCKIVNGFYLD